MGPKPTATAAASNDVNSGSESPVTPTPENVGSSQYTPLQYLAGIMIVGASAGLTLYTKKTRTMLNQMERVSKSQAQRKGPPKFGPQTKEQYEKTRPRLDEDDLF